MLDLRLAVAKALAACEEPIGEWQRDVHERPVQSLDLEVRDADGNLVATVNGTLRLHPYPAGVTQDYGTIMELPTRKLVIDLLRHPPKPPTPAAGLTAGSEAS